MAMMRSASSSSSSNSATSTGAGSEPVRTASSSSSLSSPSFLPLTWSGRIKPKLALYLFGLLSTWSLVQQSLSLQRRPTYTSLLSVATTSTSTTVAGSEFSRQLQNVPTLNEYPNETVHAEIVDDSVGASSLDRLLQLATTAVDNGALSLSIACLPTNETVLSPCDNDDRDSVPIQKERVLYVNCAATQSDDENDDDASMHAAPPSLLQCRDLLLSEMRALNDDDDDNSNNIVTIVPRHDVFLASSLSLPDTNNATLTLPSLTPLGTMHFHARHDSNSTTVPKQNDVPSEIQWFVNRVIAHHKAPYYAVLGKSLADAHGCVLLETSNDESSRYYQCSNDSSRSTTWTTPESIWDTVRPVMYQWPQHQNHHHQYTSTLAKKVDPVTPSVALFRHAFCEMETGRLLLHIPQKRRPSNNCSCQAANSNETVATPQPTVHRQVLIQLNQCNEPSFLASSPKRPRSYAPFKLKVSSTTLARDAGAYRYYDQAIVITAKWSVEYYHTVVEHLPRLLLLRDFILALPDQSMPIVVLQSYKWKTFLQFFAEIWGLGHRLVFVKAKFVVYADTMYIPEPTTCLALQPIMAQAHRRAIRHLLLPPMGAAVPNGPLAPTRTNEARQAVAQLANATKTTSRLPPLSSNWDHTDADSANDWIVVIRRNKTRFLRNHDAMMAALTSALPHETWYVFDEGNPDGRFPAPGIPQWQVFGRAKLVVAPHGAGLANLLASPTNIDVVEMLGEGIDSDLCFLHLALALGLRYHPVHMIHPGEGWNYEADIEQVVHVVKSIVQSEERSRRSSTDRPLLKASVG
jgi:Glycosyltransferase 61